MIFHSRSTVKSLIWGKENQCTSTPKKMDTPSYIRFDNLALRDVSNITPTGTPENQNRQRRSIGTKRKSEVRESNNNNKRPRCVGPEESLVFHRLMAPNIETPKTHKVTKSEVHVMKDVLAEEKFCMEEKPLEGSTLPGSTAYPNLKSSQSLLVLRPDFVPQPLVPYSSLINLPGFRAARMPIPKSHVQNTHTPGCTNQKCKVVGTIEKRKPTNLAERYQLTPLADKLDEMRFSRISYAPNNDKIMTPEDKIMIHTPCNNNSYSSEMGDLTLEKVIDAILESAKMSPSLYKSRLEKLRNTEDESRISKELEKLEQFKLEKPLPQSESDTNTEIKYSPKEKWKEDMNSENKLNSAIAENISEKSFILETSGPYNEREVRTPESNLNKSTETDLDKFNISSLNKSIDDQISKDLCKSSNYKLKRMRCIRRRRHTITDGNNLLLPNGIPSPASEANSSKSLKTPETQSTLSLPNGIPSPSSSHLTSPSCTSYQDSIKFNDSEIELINACTPVTTERKTISRRCLRYTSTPPSLKDYDDNKQVK